MKETIEILNNVYESLTANKGIEIEKVMPIRADISGVVISNESEDCTDCEKPSEKCISVSEKLPEENRDYLVTVKLSDINAIYVDINIKSDDSKY